MLGKKLILHPQFKIHAGLVVVTFLVYFFHFSDIILHPNTYLTSIIDDSLKNYYTYIFHIKHATNLLHFTGFNYPFGEHVVYTDSQPLLTFILHYLPFTHNYLIGILHLLIFFSFFFTPSIIYLIFRNLNIPFHASFVLAITINLISPQFFRIFCGHYALAYNFVIPLSLLLLFKQFSQPNRKTLIVIFLYNCLIFLIHPYFGLGLSLFSLLAFMAHALLEKHMNLKTLAIGFSTCILPIILFKLFMNLSDIHTNRPLEPIGNTDLISSKGSFFVPYFGPFKSFLEWVTKFEPAHFEGYAYLGITTIVCGLLFILLLPFFWKKVNIRNEIKALFIASLFLLLFSYGLQFKIQELLGFKIAALNQFRAMGRFSWFLYFTVPFVVFPGLYQLLQGFTSRKYFRYLSVTLVLAIFSINLLEAHFYFTLYDGVMWKDRNIFNENLLNTHEKSIIKKIKQVRPQAIIPLPVYFVGSEVYDRSNFTYPLIVSTLYAYHCNLPIVSTCASRTSITETENVIQLLNSYKQNNPATNYLTNQSFFVFKCNETVLEDEKRLFRKVEIFTENDSTQFGFLSRTKLIEPVYDSLIYEIKDTPILIDSLADIVFIEKENRKPFITSNQLNYEMMFALDSNRIRSGFYNLSLRYYPGNKTYKEMSHNFIVTRGNKNEYVWQDVLPLKLCSGFYSDFVICEYLVHLEKANRYEFIFKGNHDLNYRASHFMLRPTNTTLRVISGKDTIYNNYPQ